MSWAGGRRGAVASGDGDGAKGRNAIAASGVGSASGDGRDSSRSARNKSNGLLGGSDTRCGRLSRSIGGEDDLGNSDRSGYSGDDAAARNSTAARDCDGGLVGNLGDGASGRSATRGSRSDSGSRARWGTSGSGWARGVEGNVGGAVGDKTRVLGHLRSTDSDQVLESLLSLLVVLGPRGNALNYILGEVGVLAVAVGVGVVLAVGLNLEPCVQALGETLRRSVTGDLRLRRAGRNGELGA